MIITQMQLDRKNYSIVMLGNDIQLKVVLYNIDASKHQKGREFKVQFHLY